MGASLLFVHGAMADGRMWAPHIEHLRGRIDARAITLSHFFGGPEPRQPFDLRDHGLEISAAALRMPQPVTLVAWSYSCLPAMLAVLATPNAFDRLVLFEPGHPEWLDEQSDEAAFRADAQEFYRPIIAALPEGPEAAARAMIDASGGPGAFDRQSPEARQLEIENFPSLGAMFEGVPPPPIDRAAIAALDVPVTVWWGSDSRPAFQLPAQAAARLCGDRRSGEIGGVNHLWPSMDPRGFADAVFELQLAPAA